MACKDAERYIVKSIKSILDQTYENFEFIIVDNGSTDKTWDVINSYDDKRIRAFQTNISQLSYNLNYAVNISVGRYIARMDADDISHKTRLEKQMEYLAREGDIHVLGTGIRLMNETGIISSTLYPPDNIAIRRDMCHKTILAHPTVIIDKAKLLSVGGYMGGRYAQDIDLWIRLSRDENTIFANLSVPLLDYRIHETQSKGKRASYAEVAGYMLRESLYRKSIKFFLGTGIYCAKALVKGR